MLHPVSLFCIAMLLGLSTAQAADQPASSSRYSPAPVANRPQPTGVGLADVLRHVFQNDPGLQAAKAGLHAAHELYPQALAGWRPTVNAQTSIYATNVESSNFGRGDGATTKEASINVEQPVFTSGRTDAQVDKANALIKASYATYLQGEQDLLFDTARAYMNVIRDRQILALIVDNEEILQKEMTAVTERFEGGDITRTDVEQTAARMARAQADRIKAMGTLEASYATFQAVVGYVPSGPLYYPVAIFGFPATLDAMVLFAEEKNQILRNARFQLAAAEEDVDVHLRQLLPQITAFASYSKEYDPQPGIIDESEVQTIGLRATLTLYEGGAVRSRVREAKSRAQQRRFEILDAQKDIKADVLESWKLLKMAQDEMSSRQAEIEATKRARDGVREEARMGERTTLDILDADQEVIGAETDYVRARYNAMMAQFSLARSLGLFTPEGVGMGAMAYDPGDHYRRAGNKWFTLSPN